MRRVEEGLVEGDAAVGAVMAVHLYKVLRHLGVAHPEGGGGELIEDRGVDCDVIALQGKGRGEREEGGGKGRGNEG